MFLTNDVVSVLTEKLGFSQEDLIKVEANVDLSAKCIGYLQLIRSKTVDKSRKLEALEKLQSIKDEFFEKRLTGFTDINKARSVHYSFRNRY